MARRFIPVLILVAAVIAVQLVLTLMGSAFLLTQMTMACYYGLPIIGLCMLMGYAGQISMGHAAFFAIGGYTNAVLTTMNLNVQTGIGRVLAVMHLTVTGTDMYGTATTYLSPMLALVCAMVIAGLIAFAIGIPILRLKGHYLAMATLGFGIIVAKIIVGTKLFGGADGISGVPSFPVGPFAVSGDSAHRIENYYIAWAVLIAALVLIINLINSRAGRALKSIHGNEQAAQSIGVDTARYKLSVFVLSAVLAAVGGALLTHYNGSIGPSEISISKSVRYVAIVAVGGMANVWGALIMGLILNFLSLRGFFGSYDEAFFGVILIIIIMFFPDGLFRKPDGNIFKRWLRRP
ncbi:MAG: branched-chain amino acid ABC transporter permease [Spirochaetes bacterium]|nr:branched-chain amino acid ABC transporter permease [Spirochaetota bacterium]